MQQIKSFGQTPNQMLTTPHPPRNLNKVNPLFNNPTLAQFYVKRNRNYNRSNLKRFLQHVVRVIKGIHLKYENDGHCISLRGYTRKLFSEPSLDVLMQFLFSINFCFF